MDGKNIRDDRDYFARRARDEREMALRCKDSAVASAHLSFANAYEEKLASFRSLRPIVG